MKFDIDIENAKPGSRIEQETCEKILNVKRAEDAYGYQFALLQLCGFIQNQLWRTGKRYTVTACEGAIQVLTDEQATDYNSNHFELAVKKLRRCHRRLQAVDLSNLSDEHKKSHQAATIRQSRIVSMLRSVPKKIDLQATVPTKPTLLFKKKKACSAANPVSATEELSVVDAELQS